MKTSLRVLVTPARAPHDHNQSTIAGTIQRTVQMLPVSYCTLSHCPSHLTLHATYLVFYLRRNGKLLRRLCTMHVRHGLMVQPEQSTNKRRVIFSQRIA